MISQRSQENDSGARLRDRPVTSHPRCRRPSQVLNLPYQLTALGNSTLSRCRRLWVGQLWLSYRGSKCGVAQEYSCDALLLPGRAGLGYTLRTTVSQASLAQVPSCSHEPLLNTGDVSASLCSNALCSRPWLRLSSPSLLAAYVRPEGRQRWVGGRGDREAGKPARG